ncbi:glycosyltransferase [Candidatus Enterovibrio escicola]|uniref:glycosyltransferase n=1 Tax=Candidatus Enterovibrio escicola TaxID=1927127 RepID=UPI00123810B9|nr:glycosyltransferase [Candidatus Enterovibrio escacola]
MKTIIQVVQHLKVGGLETMVLGLLRFSNYSQQMTIISLEGDKESAIEAWPQLEYFQEQLIFLNKPAGFSLVLIFQLLRIFIQLHADVVHTHHIGPYFYAGLASRLASISLIHTEHDAWHYKNKRHQLLQRIINFLTTPTVIADADTVANTLNTLVGMKNIQVIKNGVDIDKYIPGNQNSAREELNLLKDIKLIGVSGRLEGVKGHHVLIEAMSILPSDVHLAIAGIGSLKDELIALSTSLKITDRVHFLGYVNNMTCFYQALDLFCLPSYNEGFPLASLEAQACDIPTALTNVGGAIETLCPKSGIVLKVGDAKDMAEKILTYLYEGIVTSPRQFVVLNANIRTMVSAYDALTEISQYG